MLPNQSNLTTLKYIDPKLRHLLTIENWDITSKPIIEKFCELYTFISFGNVDTHFICPKDINDMFEGDLVLLGIDRNCMDVLDLIKLCTKIHDEHESHGFPKINRVSKNANKFIAESYGKMKEIQKDAKNASAKYDALEIQWKVQGLSTIPKDNVVEEDDIVECCVCFTRLEFVELNCGHSNICSGCANRVIECPMCGTKIESITSL